MRARLMVVGWLACACAGLEERPPEPAPTPPPTPAAPLVAADATIEASPDAGSSAQPPSRPPMPELSKERADLADKLARAHAVVRGRVREAKEVVEQRPGGAVRYHYAIIDVLEWIEGDAKTVHKAYAKSFPIWNTPLPVLVSKSPGVGYRDPPLELTGRAGEERLFLVNLPREDNLGWGTPGPPAFILKRWGKYSVGVQDHLPLDARDEIAATRQDVARRKAWIEDNARSLRVRDRFGGASPEAVARGVASFVVGQLRQRAKLKVDAGTPERFDGDVEVFRFPLSGDADATGTLGVSVFRSTGRLRHFSLDVPHVKDKAAAPSGTEASILADAKSELGIESEGGELFGQASTTYRGDGLTFWKVSLHAGYLFGRRLGAASRTVSVSMTQGSRVVFEYTNAWAGPPKAAAAPESDP